MGTPIPRILYDVAPPLKHGVNTASTAPHVAKKRSDDVGGSHTSRDPRLRRCSRRSSHAFWERERAAGTRQGLLPEVFVMYDQTGMEFEKALRAQKEGSIGRQAKFMPRKFPRPTGPADAADQTGQGAKIFAVMLFAVARFDDGWR